MPQDYIELDLEDYIQFLLNKPPSEYLPVPNKSSNDIDIFELICNRYDININELFLDKVKKGDLLSVKKLANDFRVQVNCLNNEAIILILLNNRINVFEYLLSLEIVDPSDQDFLALRIAMIQKNKYIIEILLKHPKIIQNIIHYPEIMYNLNFM